MSETSNYEVRFIPLSRLRWDKSKLNEENVRQLMVSIRLHRLQSPIQVALRMGGMKVVSGAHRAEAFERLNLNRIPCIVIEGTLEEKRTVQIEENLVRQRMDVLRRSEEIVDWVEVTQAMTQKSQTSVVKQMPFAGSPAARLKLFKRAQKISAISSAAKKAAREAGFADNQAALLKIADFTSEQEQLSEVSRLSTRGRSKPKAGTPSQKNMATDKEKASGDKLTPKPEFKSFLAVWKNKMEPSYERLPLPDRQRFARLILPDVDSDWE